MYILSEFFGRDMLFYTFDDFVNRRDYIKSEFIEKDFDYKVMYDLYVESRPWIKDYYRGCIWDYLNDYLTDEELLIEYEKYKKRYGGCQNE